MKELDPVLMGKKVKEMIKEGRAFTEIDEVISQCVWGMNIEQYMQFLYEVGFYAVDSRLGMLEDEHRKQKRKSNDTK